MTANIASLPSSQRQALLKELGASPAPVQFVETLGTFTRQSWGLSKLEHLVPSVQWRSEPKSPDIFAKLLGRYCIEFTKPDDTSDAARAQGAKPSELERRAGEEILKAMNEANARRQTLGFTRALPIASVLNDALLDASPVHVIEKHMRQVFRADPPVEFDQPIQLKESDPLVQLFRSIQLALARAFPADPRCDAIGYFLSSPHKKKRKGGLTIQRLRKLVEIGHPYTRLLFVRFTAHLYQGLDPNPEQWSDLSWLFDFAQTPWELMRVMDACFELLDQWDLFRDPAGGVDVAVDAFFAKVRREQEKLGGRSFWDEQTANEFVYDFFLWRTGLDNVRTDFHSHLAWIAQQEFEPGEPGFDEWAALVRKALDDGYVIVAQALTAYRLFEEVLLLDRITDWPAFTGLNRLLREEPNYDLLSTAIQTCGQIWEMRGRALLAERLLSQAPREPRQPEQRALHVIEGTARVGLKEVELRLIEHIGKANWAKLVDCNT